MTVSYTEIYDGKVLDLLSPDKFASRRSSREISPPAAAGVLNLDGVTEFPVLSAEDMCKFKDHGDHVRRTGNHRLSCCSASLSHAVFSIRIGHSNHTHRSQPPGHIHIIDLASSNVTAHLHSHYCQDDPPTREMVRAAAAVDSTLNDLCLALHSAASCEVVAGHHELDSEISVPENPLLTQLLKGAQWNQTQCVLLACITPANTSYQETVNTLEFASRCSAMASRCSTFASRRAAHSHKTTLTATRQQKQAKTQDTHAAESQCEQPQAAAGGRAAAATAADPYPAAEHSALRCRLRLTCGQRSNNKNLC